MKTFFDYHKFILEHCPQARTWDKLAFSMWLTLMRDTGGVVVVLDDKDEIVALACAYPVMREEQIDEYIDPEGPMIFVDLAVSTRKGGLQALGFALLKRFGMREKIAFRRWPYNVIKVYDAKKIRRNLFRANKHLMETRKDAQPVHY